MISRRYLIIIAMLAALLIASGSGITVAPTIVKPTPAPITTATVTPTPTPAPVTCPSGCVCLTDAEAKTKGYVSYCGGQQMICGYDQYQNKKYCYLPPPTTTPTTLPTPTPAPVTCPSGCVCLLEEEGKLKGYPLCGSSSILCEYDTKLQKAKYCFEKPPETTAPVYTTCPAGCYCMDTGTAEGKGFSYCGGRQVLCGETSTGMKQYCFQQEPLCPSGCLCMDPSTAVKMGFTTLCGGEKKVCAIIGSEWYCYDKFVTATPTTTSPAVGPLTHTPIPEITVLPRCTISGKILGFQHDPATMRIRIQEMEWIHGGCSLDMPSLCMEGGYTAKAGTEPIYVGVTPVFAGDLLSHLTYTADVNCSAIYSVRPVYRRFMDSCEWSGTFRYSRSHPVTMTGASVTDFDITYVSGDNIVPRIEVAPGPLAAGRHREEGGWNLTISASDAGGVGKILVRGNWTENYFTADEKGPLEGIEMPWSHSVLEDCNTSPCNLTIMRTYGPIRNISLDLVITACDQAGNMNRVEYRHVFPDEPGDLRITGAEPVQVVYGVPLVKWKGTAFRVNVTSTFPYPVETKFRLALPESEWGTVSSTGRLLLGFPAGWRYPDEWGPVVIPANANDFSVMLPVIPEWKRESAYSPNGTELAGLLIRGRGVGGIYGPDVRIVPKPTGERVRFTASVDPANTIPETDESNNMFTSPAYETVTTRAWRFYFVKFRGGEGGDCAPYGPYAESGAKEQIEHLLAVFPIADSKIEYAIAPDLFSMPCVHNPSLTCNYATVYSELDDQGRPDRGRFLGKIRDMALENDFNFGVAIGCACGGGAAGDGAVMIGDCSGHGAFLLSHEFNHAVVPMDDIYSLDCYSSWDESYCELPSGDRFYCCYGMYDKEKTYRRNVLRIDPGLGCIVDCSMDTSVCNSTCCRDRCQTECSRRGGRVYGSPDMRTGPMANAAEGFWVNNWSPQKNKTYFMVETGDNGWITTRSTQDIGALRSRDPTCPIPGGITKDGYLNLLRSRRFVSVRDPEAIFIRGTVSQEGKVQLKPFIRLTEAGLDLEPGGQGSLFIVLLDSKGSVINRFGFDPNFYISDPGGRLLDETSFSYRVEWDSQVSRIEIQDGAGTTLASRIVSAHAPEVRILSPKGGEFWEIGRSAAISWEASDQDGDRLVYSIAFSPDDGKTWLPIAIDHENKSLAISGVRMEPGQYLVRVRASDGVNTGEAISGGKITVGERPETTRAGDAAGSIFIVACAILVCLAIARVRRGR